MSLQGTLTAGQPRHCHKDWRLHLQAAVLHREGQRDIGRTACSVAGCRCAHDDARVAMLQGVRNSATGSQGERVQRTAKGCSSAYTDAVFTDAGRIGCMPWTVHSLGVAG
jgi:hypothetical protein